MGFVQTPNANAVCERSWMRSANTARVTVRVARKRSCVHALSCPARARHSVCAARTSHECCSRGRAARLNVVLFQGHAVVVEVVEGRGGDLSVVGKPHVLHVTVARPREC